MRRTVYVQSLNPLKSRREDLTPSEQKSHGHDTHALPPLAVLESYKKYQRMNSSDIDNDLDIVDFERGLSVIQEAKIVPVATVLSETIMSACVAFQCHDQNADVEPRGLPNLPNPCTVYEHKEFNGQ